MKYIYIIKSIACITLAVLGMQAFAAKNCPTLSQIGIQRFTEENLSLPFTMTDVPLYCRGEHKGACYEAWNLGKEQNAQGWLILVVVETRQPERALEQVNQSGIFDAAADDRRSGLGCHASINNTEVHFYAPTNP